jgi:hypothetical protein
VIAAYRRHDLRATEAGLKYFVLGALSSGMLLYGASLIYGFAGSVRFPEIAHAVVAICPGFPKPVPVTVRRPPADGKAPPAGEVTAVATGTAGRFATTPTSAGPEPHTAG